MANWLVFLTESQGFEGAHRCWGAFEALKQRLSTQARLFLRRYPVLVLGVIAVQGNGMKEYKNDPFFLHTGKSERRGDSWSLTLAAAMRSSMLVINADQRFRDVLN